MSKMKRERKECIPSLRSPCSHKLYKHSGALTSCKQTNTLSVLFLGPTMGLPFSVLNKLGVPGLSSMTTGQIYDRYFKNEKTDNFEDFHVAYVEFCKYLNIIMPGQDFDTPSRTEIEKFFKEEWNKLTDADKKTRFIGYMEEKVTVATVDDRLFIVAGLAAPAAAIVAKRTTENIPQVKRLKLHYVPNVVFVPVCTLLAIMGASALQMSKKSKESAIQMSKKS